MKKLKIAIIGAGISGITLANNLKEIAEVKIFEKSRGVGGRMSSRYSEKFSFDHGAQYFSARGREFQNFLQSFISSKDVLPWIGKVINIEDKKITDHFWFETHLVACPNMNSLCKKMSQGLDITIGTEVATLTKKQDLWNLCDINNHDLGSFNLVISSAPPIQTKKLFGDYFNIKEIAMQPCFSMMLGFEKKWQNDWIFAKVKNNPIKLIAINSSKPARNCDVTSIVIQTKKGWSLENIDSTSEDLQKILLENFTNLVGISSKEASYISLHRWLYALVDEVGGDIFFDQKNALAATGDWACDSRIEDVWIAANKLSQAILTWNKS
jgi:renalase